MRPRFVIDVACSADEVMSALRSGAGDVDASFSERRGVLSIPEARCHFWSPQLGLTIQDGSEAGATEVLGIFSPQPEIWTGFVFAIPALTDQSFAPVSTSMAQTLCWVLDSRRSVVT